MALPDSVKLVDGTNFVLAHGADWTTGAFGWGEEDYEFDLTSLASAAARQSPKIDFTANRDIEWNMECCVEMATDPAAGGSLNFYMGYSDSATAGTGNPANLSGSDAAYSGYTASTLAEGLSDLTHIGIMSVAVMNDTDAEPQIGYVASFTPKKRYGILVVENNTSVALHATMDNTGVRIYSNDTQAQD